MSNGNNGLNQLNTSQQNANTSNNNNNNNALQIHNFGLNPTGSNNATARDNSNDINHKKPTNL